MSVKSRKIIVDGFNLAMPKGTGVASYARSLTESLRDMGHEIGIVYGMNIFPRTPIPLREVIFFDSLSDDAPPRRIKNFSARWWRNRLGDVFGHHAVEVPILGRVDARSFASRLPEFDRLWNIPNLFARAARHFRRTGQFMTISVPGAPEIMHWTYPLPIRLKGAKNIYTIHDLVPLRLPYTTLDDKSYYYRLIRRIARDADAICTVSEASKQDIISFFPDCAPRIHNTYQSFQVDPSASTRPREDVGREVKALFDLNMDDFFLFFGSLEPKKNIGRLIEAFLGSQTKRPLVIVGAMAWKSEGELRFIKQGIDQGRIVRLEYLPRPMLNALIRCARAVLFPSLSEGFGLPVLEALSVGTPVLTSPEGALPEVVGDTAVVVDAYDTKSIASGIDRLDQDEGLCAKIRSEAADQVRKFDMPSYGERLTAMYDAVSHTH